MKKGFTLAEVLITLAIIGIVAALTIPTVIANYQKSQFYTQFMKVYNTLSNAVQISSAENGNPISWVFDSENKVEGFKKYLGNYLKISKYCTGDPASCNVGADTPVKALNYSGNTGYSLYNYITDSTVSFYTEDGTLYAIQVNTTAQGHISRIYIYVDLNGTKGPNILGRDVYILHIAQVKDSCVLMPARLYESESNGTLNTLDTFKGSDTNNNCTMSSTSFGWACGARLLLEGKMDY